MTRGSLCILSHLESPELDAMARDMPGLRFVTIPEDGPLPEGTRGDACLTFAWGSPNMADVVATGVRWVHTIGTGVDRFPLDAVAGTPLTCSRGASAIPISEWTLAMLLAFEKQIPERWVNKPPEQWHIADLGGLHGRTLGLIGLGGIAQAVAQRALAFGMRTLAYRRRPELPSPIEGVEIVGDLTRLLESSDHVVVAASATPQTHHMINAERLAQMKPGAHLVNVARGSLLDQEALRGTFWLNELSPYGELGLHTTPRSPMLAMGVVHPLDGGFAMNVGAELLVGDGSPNPSLRVSLRRSF